MKSSKRTGWWWPVVLFFVLAVVSLLALGGWKLYPLVKVWRARQLTAQAQKLFDNHKLSDAETKLIAAHNLAPNDAEVLRSGARMELAAGKPQTLAFFQQLLQLPDATRADRRDAIRASIAFGDLKNAKEMADALIASNPGAEDYALEAQVSWGGGRTEEAITLVKKARDLEPQNRDVQFLLAEMILLGGKNDSRPEAARSLQQLAEGQDLSALKSLEVLAQYSSLDDGARRKIIEQLRKHPMLDETGRFSAWGLESRIGDRQPRDVLKEVVEFFKTADLPTKARAARWLYMQKQPQLALEIARPPDSLGNGELFLARLDALAYLKDWAGIKKELSDNSIPLTQARIYLYLARADAELGDMVKSRADWERARAAAADEPGMLIHLGEIATMMGAYDEATKAFSKLTQQSAERGLQYYTLLVQAEARAGKTAELLATLKQMTIDLPYEPNSHNDWAYLSLLLNQNIPEALKIAQKLVQDNPQYLSYRSTLALACLRSNDPASAAKVYQGVKVDWATAPPNWKTIYAVVLAANGDLLHAQEQIRGITRAQLRPEELDLVNTYITKSAATSSSATKPAGQ